MIHVKKLSAARGRLKLFRLTRSVKMGDTDASVHADAMEDREQAKTLSPDAYLLAKTRKHEIETLKAMVVLQSRHERWRAGGPL